MSQVPSTADSSEPLGGENTLVIHVDADLSTDEGVADFIQGLKRLESAVHLNEALPDFLFEPEADRG